MAEKAEIEVFRTLLGIVGVGLGVVTVIAAFLVVSYITLPAVIFFSNFTFIFTNGFSSLVGTILQ